MKKQEYSNHRKYYAPHHFIFLPLLGILLALGIRNALSETVNQVSWSLFSVTIFCILYLAIMVRQHYALGNQDRIVRLEFRLRYFELFAQRSDAVEKQITFEQIAALRFANDEEFIKLLGQAIKENLSGDQIKKAIKNWQADDHRV